MTDWERKKKCRDERKGKIFVANKCCFLW